MRRCSAMRIGRTRISTHGSSVLRTPSVLYNSPARCPRDGLRRGAWTSLTLLVRHDQHVRDCQSYDPFACVVLPWHNLPQNSLVVDVGGGIGSVSVQIALAQPHLRFIVQDRAETIKVAPSVWGGKNKDLFDSGRISFQEQDFFKEQPQGQTPAVYLVTRVVHNLSDERCKQYVYHVATAYLLPLPLVCGCTPLTTSSAPF